MSSSMSMSMDMGSTATAASSMTMAMSSTATSAAAAATSSMSMDMDMGTGDCKISMLWNWYTIDACFLSKSWHITSKGMFAASCIGVMFLVVALEFCRRISKEYDTYIVRQFKNNLNARAAAIPSQAGSSCEGSEPAFATFRATPLQQLVRSIMHAVVFGLAYIVMLLAMYYNGYILISIFLGAGIGKFLCDWMVVQIPLSPQHVDDSTKDIGRGVEEPSVCCG